MTMRLATMRRIAVIVLLAAVVLAVGAGEASAAWPKFTLGQAGFPRPGLLPQLAQDSRLLGRVPGLGEDHRLAEHRLPGREAGLPALEPDRLRHVLRRVCVGVADPGLLDRFPPAGDRLRRAADGVYPLPERPGGEQPAGAHAGASPLLVRHASEQGGGEDRRSRRPIRTRAGRR